MTLLSILASNAIAVPLSPSLPTSELRYILDNSEAQMVIASARYQVQAEKVSLLRQEEQTSHHERKVRSKQEERSKQKDEEHCSKQQQDNSKCASVLNGSAEKVSKILELLILEKYQQRLDHNPINLEQQQSHAGMMLYTSGTTGKPVSLLNPSIADSNRKAFCCRSLP